MTCETARSVVSSKPLRGVPGDVAGSVPLLAGGLVYEFADVVGPERSATTQPPLECGRSGLGHGSEGREPRAWIGIGRKGPDAPVGGVQLSVTKRWGSLSLW